MFFCCFKTFFLFFFGGHYWQHNCLFQPPKSNWGNESLELIGKISFHADKKNTNIKKNLCLDQQSNYKYGKISVLQILKKLFSTHHFETKKQHIEDVFLKKNLFQNSLHLELSSRSRKPQHCSYQTDCAHIYTVSQKTSQFIFRSSMKQYEFIAVNGQTMTSAFPKIVQR